LAGYFADREGLSGAARARFLRLLSESLGVDRPTHNAGWRELLTGATVMGLACLGLDYWAHGGGVSFWLIVVWVACSIVGIGLSLVHRWVERKTPEPSLDIHWRVYCLLIRPILLAEQPGLLDRNLKDDKSATERIVVRPVSTLRGMVAERGADFWWALLIGLWGGMLVALTVRLLFEPKEPLIVLLFPLIGSLLGPIVWTLWQCFAFWVARKDPRLDRG
jgi:hypothetical protein